MKEELFMKDKLTLTLKCSSTGFTKNHNIY